MCPPAAPCSSTASARSAARSRGSSPPTTPETSSTSKRNSQMKGRDSWRRRTCRSTCRQSCSSSAWTNKQTERERDRHTGHTPSRRPCCASYAVLAGCGRSSTFSYWCRRSCAMRATHSSQSTDSSCSGKTTCANCQRLYCANAWQGNDLLRMQVYLNHCKFLYLIKSLNRCQPPRATTCPTQEHYSQVRNHARGRDFHSALSECA